MAAITINQAFDAVLVVNLDRRADRLAAVTRQCEKLGVTFTRIAAVDALEPEIAERFAAYRRLPLASLPAGVDGLASERDFYLDYADERARLPYLEARTGHKAIASAGAFAHLHSMINALRHTLDAGYRRTLILEDDARFHKRTLALFPAFWAQLPDDWQVLQLGTMQLNWDPGWVEWHSRNLYRCRGSSIASHAFAVDRTVVPLLLERAERLDLPFDLGALHHVKHTAAMTSYTMFPNLVIQDAADSDIRTSTVFFAQMRRRENVYRWQLGEYGDPDRPQAPAAGPATSRDAALVEAVGSGVAAAAELRPAQAAAPPPARYDAPALRRLDGERPSRRVFIAVVTGLAAPALEQALDLLKEQSEALDVETVLVTDQLDFTAFRRRGMIFEYLAPVEARRARRDDLDWELFELRRLALLRRKWQPGRIVGFGEKSARLLRAWRQSVFEDDSIAYLIPDGGPDGSPDAAEPAGQ